MEIINALGMNVSKQNVISLVGAGGKTSTIFRLSNEMKALSKKVLITTTTAIFHPENHLYDHIIVSESLEEIMCELETIPVGSITVLGSRIIQKMKLKGISKEWVDLINNRELFDCILVEADGSKRKPIKAPAEYEPVLPDSTNILIGVIGFDCYGKPIGDKWVHRPEIFTQLINKKMGSSIDKDGIIKLVISSEGLFKGSLRDVQNILLLNKIFSEKDYENAKELGRAILSKDQRISKVLLGCVKENNPIKLVLG